MSEEEAVRAAWDVLPWWVAWAPVLSCLLAVVLIGWGISGLAGWLSRRRLPDPAVHHWTERARLAWPLRRNMALVALLLPGTAILCSIILTGPLARRGAWLTLLAVVVSVAATLPASRKFTEALFGRQFAWRRWIGGTAAIALCIAAYATLPLGLGRLWFGPPGPLAWLLIAVGLLAPVLVSRGDILTAFRWLGLVEPTPERLVRVVGAAAKRVGVQPRPVVLLRWHLANAAAFPLGRRVVFTSAALDALNDEQLEAVAIHELAHVAEPRWALAIRLAGPVLLFSAPIVVLAAFPGISGLPEGLLVIVVVVAITLAPYRWFGRRMEERADRIVREALSEPRVYAAALERLHERSLIPVVRGSRSSVHADLYDRMIRAGQKPSYPRPKPPRGHVVGAILLLVAACVTPFVVRLGLHSVSKSISEESGYPARLALTGRVGTELARAASHAVVQRDLERAIALQRAAAAIEEDDYRQASTLALYLLFAIRCREAEAAVGEARNRLTRGCRKCAGQVQNMEIAVGNCTVVPAERE